MIMPDNYVDTIDRTVLLDDTLKNEFRCLLSKENVIKLIVLDLLKYVNSQEEFGHDNLNILSVMPSILQLQNDKEKLYGRSWCKFGEIGIFMNVARKYDRLENIIKKVAEFIDSGTPIPAGELDTATESFFDTKVDLALYAIMWVGYIKENRPDLFNKFLIDNQLQLE